MANGKKTKNAVVDAKCKLSAEECQDKNCPVHGEPETEESETDQTSPAATNEITDESSGNQAAPQPPTIGDEKVADVEAQGKLIAASSIEVPIVDESAIVELIEFVKSKGYSEEAARELLSTHGDQIRADFEMAKLGGSEDVLNDAASVIENMQHKDESIVALLEAIADSDSASAPQNLLRDAQAVLKAIPHPNDFIHGVLARIDALLK